jgi:hypothetical protein
MTTAATVIGWFLMCSFAIVMICYAIGYLLGKLERLLLHYKTEVAKGALHHVGRELQGDACWFTESEDTSLALKLLGDNLVNKQAWNISELREEWRRQRKVRT